MTTARVIDETTELDTSVSSGCSQSLSVIISYNKKLVDASEFRVRECALHLQFKDEYQ